ncbi:PilZ domain-containing protein [Salinicola halimionae]|uniref:PilZ domain-containing protein n=1 Tax=Salinicola halimionae TaxID=1949081 RepID=UPI000DA23FD6|nr:PilZ domain-containing protein [Salinicola halimionae]
MNAQKALSLTIRDDDTLRSAYMPWLERGGLFVPTELDYRMGQSVHLWVTLPDESGRFPVDGEVVWLTPSGASHRLVGIGVHFSADDHTLRERIETRLRSAKGSGGATSYTL